MKPRQDLASKAVPTSPAIRSWSVPYSWRTVICNRNDSAQRQQIQPFVGRSLAFYCQSLISQEDTRRHIKAKTSDFRETDTNLYLRNSDRLTDPCYDRRKRQSHIGSPESALRTETPVLFFD